jgi:hypothetical protein
VVWIVRFLTALTPRGRESHRIESRQSVVPELRSIHWFIYTPRILIAHRCHAPFRSLAQLRESDTLMGSTITHRATRSRSSTLWYGAALSVAPEYIIKAKGAWMSVTRWRGGDAVVRRPDYTAGAIVVHGTQHVT